MAVLPADPFIGDEDGFRQVARRALEHAGDAIVAIGVKPTHPETGFGYIRAGVVVAADGTRAVEAFVERPSREVAETYLASGNYYWNAGRMGDECRLHLPAMADAFEAFVAADDFSAVVRARYGQVPAISIDYGIMEKALGMKVVPGAFGWNDVGSWAAVHAIRKPDADGNVLVGDVTAADAKGNLVVSEPGAPLVSVVGVQDLVVVATADAVLVVPRDRAQDVRLAVEALKKAQRNSLL
jgi:mannose-1-phosphate guanylyltransferase